jgi:hypothetical protein
MSPVSGAGTDLVRSTCVMSVTPSPASSAAPHPESVKPNVSEADTASTITGNPKTKNRFAFNIKISFVRIAHIIIIGLRRLKPMYARRSRN